MKTSKWRPWQRAACALVALLSASAPAWSEAPPAFYLKDLWRGQARPAIAIEASGFGAHTTMLTEGIERGRSDEILDLIRDGGFTWVKDTMACYAKTGDDVARVCTAYFDLYESTFFQLLPARRLTPLIRLDFKYDGKFPTTDEGISSYAAYARLVVRRFSPFVKHWEILNEPNILKRDCDTLLPTCAPNIRSNDYVRIVQAVSAAIKQEDPSAKVHATALAMLQAMHVERHIPLPQRWLDGYFNMVDGRVAYTPYDYFANVTPSIDFVSIHPYRVKGVDTNLPEYASQFAMSDGKGGRIPPDPYLSEIAALKERMRMASPREVPVSITETGYCEIVDRTLDKDKECLSHPIIQAKYDQRSAILDHIAGLAPRIHFAFHRSPNANVKEKSFEMVQKVNGAFVPKPAYRAAQSINSLLDSSMVKGRSSCTVVSGGGTVIQAHMMERRHSTLESVCLYWAQQVATANVVSPTEVERVTLEIPTQHHALPILVDLFGDDGTARSPVYPAYEVVGDKLVVRDLPLRDSPMALILVPKYIASLSDLEYLQFNEEAYLRRRPDVARAIRLGQSHSGLANYVQYGKDTWVNPTPLFDERYYISQNADAAAAVQGGQVKNGYEHFVKYGMREGRNPNALFDSKAYLTARPDIRGMSAYEHYVRYGHKERVNPGPNFNERSYLAAYPDAAAAVAAKRFRSGFFHYLAVGQFEGKVALP